MRGRNRSNKGPNPLTRSYESNGPDVKIRGTAQHIAEKYSQLARDAQASGDPVAAENYFQHAEHYFRIIAAAQEQLREQFGYQQRFEDDGDEEGGFSGERPFPNGEDGDFGSQPQPFESRQERGEGDRQPRFDRGDRQERGDRRDRFGRDRNQRRDFQGDDQRQERGERPPRREFQGEDQRQERGDRQERGERAERPERQERTEFRRDRRRDEPEAAEVNGLPAFLTNPVRQPVATEGDESPAAETAPAGETNGEFRARPRTRRRRTRDFTGEGAPEGGADVTTDAVETPPAE
jgi:hypothetical protein